MHGLDVSLASSRVCAETLEADSWVPKEMFPAAVLTDCVCRVLHTGAILKAPMLHAWGGAS